MAINVTTSKQQIQANVAEDKVTATVSAGFGATGPAGPQGPAGPSYTLPVAGASLGGVKSGGTGITIDNAGVISVTSGAYATLVNGTVPSNQLPSYVDDIIEVANYGSLPSPGETGKIYVDLQTNKVYRWSGFVYIEIVASPGSTDSLAEGSVNLYYTNARASAAAPVQSVAGRTGTVVIAAADIASGTLAAARLPIASAGSLGAVRIGSGISIDGDGVITATAASVAWNDITGKPSTFTPSSHTHGNITNDGKVGTAADKVLITGSAGAVTATSSITYSHVASTSTYTNFSTTPGDLHGALSEIDSALSGKAATTEIRYKGAWSAGEYVSGDLVYKSSVAGSEVSGYIGTLWVCTDSATNDEPDGTTAAWTRFEAVAESHAHSASDVTSGTFDIARIPTGTSSTTVSLGNHTHSQLHDRSHAMTSTSDHTAGNWKVFHSNGSGELVELAVGASGTVLKANGTSSAPTFSAIAASQLPVVLEQTEAVGNSGSTKTLSLTTGSVQTVTLSASCTFTMPTATAGASITLILTQGSNYTATFTGVKWPNGTAPTITATTNAIDVLVFVSDGTNWYGVASQKFS